MRLPTGVKRKSRLPGRGGGEVLDDLMDLGEFPSSSVRSRKRKQLTSKKGYHIHRPISCPNSH